MYDIAPLWRKVCRKMPLRALMEMRESLTEKKAEIPVIQRAIADIDQEFSRRNLTECMKMRIEDIKIHPCFKEHPPKTEKIEHKRQYFRKTGLLQSEIILDSGNYLIDGYTSYLLAKENHVEYVLARYGKRQIVRAYHKKGGKLYAWELPGIMTDCIFVGDKVIVHTQRGIKTVTVAAVEEYNPKEYPDPLKTVIRKKRK